MAARIGVNGITIAYEDAGEGPAVVFVHGLGGSVYTWRAQTAACAERGYRAIGYDQRGHGLSDKPPGPYSVAQCVEDLCALLDGLEVESCALVGHSVGTMIAEQASIRL